MPNTSGIDIVDTVMIIFLKKEEKLISCLLAPSGSHIDNFVVDKSLVIAIIGIQFDAANFSINAISLKDGKTCAVNIYPLLHTWHKLLPKLDHFVLHHDQLTSIALQGSKVIGKALEGSVQIQFSIDLKQAWSKEGESWKLTINEVKKLSNLQDSPE